MLLDAAEALDVPAELVAVTVKLYMSPLVKPDGVQDVVLVVHAVTLLVGATPPEM